MNVTIERVQQRFSRTRNGAWRYASTESETITIDESQLTSSFSLGSGILATWPDGVKERAWPGNRGVGNYPAECIPRDGRLSKLLVRPK